VYSRARAGALLAARDRASTLLAFVPLEPVAVCEKCRREYSGAEWRDLWGSVPRQGRREGAFVVETRACVCGASERLTARRCEEHHWYLPRAAAACEYHTREAPPCR
jgi:hypothetical protein